MPGPIVKGSYYITNPLDIQIHYDTMTLQDASCFNFITTLISSSILHNFPGSGQIYYEDGRRKFTFLSLLGPRFYTRPGVRFR